MPQGKWKQKLLQKACHEGNENKKCYRRHATREMKTKTATEGMPQGKRKKNATEGMPRGKWEKIAIESMPQVKWK